MSERKKMGRPLKEIDEEEFEKLCGLNCTLVEIAGWFKCSEDTIERWCVRTYNVTFAEIYKKHSAQGKISLRRKMFELALSGNPTMCVWLSKQHLGMADKVEQKQNVEVKQLSPAEIEKVLTEDPFILSEKK
jgi:hypothetical protein